jgi:hypothetical protein
MPLCAVFPEVSVVKLSFYIVLISLMITSLVIFVFKYRYVYIKL